MIFRKREVQWHKVYESVEIAQRRVPVNSAVIVLVGKQKLCLAHSKAGFFALDNKCPHQGGSLGEGEISEKGEIICPWHKYSFDLKTGKDTCGLGDYVDTYSVEQRDDGLFIGIPKISWKFFS